MQEDSILVATTTFFCAVDGQLVRVSGGATVRVGHPITKGREEMFKPLKVQFEYEPPKSTAKRAAPKPAPEGGAS